MTVTLKFGHDRHGGGVVVLDYQNGCHVRRHTPHMRDVAKTDRGE
ncbi:hypothetical protein [Sphingomonas sp. Leaf21]|nr:hypothetical protein [Sphingomonas sp. Leaf21]